jgi:hypothetical protein
MMACADAIGGQGRRAKVAALRKPNDARAEKRLRAGARERIRLILLLICGMLMNIQLE